MPLISDEDWSAQQGQMGLQPVGHPDGLRMTPHEFEAPRRTNVPPGAEMFGTDDPGAPITTPPTSGEIWGAAFDKENDVLNVARYLNRQTDFGPVDPDHNPLDVIKGTELEEYRDSFLTSRNAAETNAIKESLERQLENNRILAAGGAVEAFLAMGAASVLSPTTLLPFGTVMKGARLGRAALQTAGRTGAWTGAAIGAQEVVLQSVQETRTLNESLLNVGAGVVLGGLLGAGASAFGSRRLAKVSAAIDRDIATARAIKDGTLDAGAEFDRFVGGGRPAPGAMADAGAAVTRPLAEAEMAGSMGLGRAFAWTNPLSRVMQSSIRASRNAITRLAEVPFLLKQNERGIPTGPEGGTVETRIKVDGDLALYRMQSAIYDAFAEHRFQDPKAWFAQSRAWIEGRGPNKLTFTEFKQEVTKALRLETAEHGIQHPVPEVKKAAEVIRKDLFNRFRDEATKLGIFSKDADFLAGYMMRRYDVPKILAEHTKFRDILVDWLSKGQARAADQLARLERELAAKQADAAPTPEIAQLRQAIDDIKQRWAVDPEMLDTHMGMWEHVVQRNPKKPETLSEWVKRNGGIKDEAREVEHMLGSRKEAGRIIDNKRGSSLDDMTLRAWEQGFFGARADRPTIREFLDLLDEDVRSGRSVRAQDEDALTDWDMAQEFRADLEASGALTTTSPDRARRLITQWLREQSPVEQTVRADLHADRQTLAGLREQLARAETDEERALIQAEIDKLSDNMGDVQAALSGMEARRAADGGPTAEELDEIYGEAVRRLYAGETLAVDRSAIAAQFEFASRYQHVLPDSTRFGVMEKVTLNPKNNAEALITFVLADGQRLNIRQSVDFLLARAIYVSDFDAVLFPIFSGREVSSRQATGIYHEATHAKWNILDPVDRDRLVAHAQFLRVGDMQLGTVLRAIGDPTWRGPHGIKTLEERYSELYAKYPDIQDYLNQEYVAHMQELHLAGFFDDADVAPVLDDLMALRGGSPAAAVPDQTAAIADLMGRFGIDPDEFSVIVSRLTEAAQSDDPVTSATEILQDVVARYGMDVDPEQIGEIARAFSDFGPEGITDTLAALSGGRSPLGMPLFAVGGGRIEPPRRGPEVSPEILGLAQAIATRFGMEMPDLAAKSFDDQISLLEKFLGQAEKVAQKGLKTATGEMQDILNQLDELRFFANANRQELEDIANETIAKITGSPAGRMINPFDSEFLQGKAGPLQARTLRIPDLHISDKGHAFADFLDDDIERVASSYVRSMAPDIALTREFGDLNLTETLRQIEDEAARLSEAQPEKSAQIQKQKTKDMRDLQDIVKRLRGTYNVNHDPSAWGPWTARRLKEWNVLRLMGAVVVSSIPDVMRLLMVHGFRNNADVFRTFAVDLKSLRIPKDQAKEMSAGLEFVMSKAGPMWDAFDDFGGHSRFDQTMQAATKKFGRLSLMDAWNSTLKQLSGAMTTSRVLRASVELSEGRISPKDLRKLAKSGISEDMALEIAKQYKQHGGMHGHLWLANANAWDQTDLAKRAAQALRAAVRKEADITIVTPGQEKPLWTSTHVGSVLAQFRTFQLVSVQRTLIPAVQEADAAIIVAVAGMIGLGMLSERLKQIVHGKKGGPETTGDWLYAGVANGGVLGWITDADQTLHKASRGNVSAARLLFGSDRPISRFASQNVTGSMLGPSFGAGQDLVTAFGGATTGDLSQGDIRAMRRLLPYQNLFYLSRALRAGEQGAMEAAGVPERRAN